jgi:hypothetical protein
VGLEAVGAMAVAAEGMISGVGQEVLVPPGVGAEVEVGKEGAMEMAAEVEGMGRVVAAEQTLAAVKAEMIGEEDY